MKKTLYLPNMDNDKAVAFMRKKEALWGLGLKYSFC